MKKFIGYLCGALLIGSLISAFTHSRGVSASGAYVQMCTDARFDPNTVHCPVTDTRLGRSNAALGREILAFSCGDSNCADDTAHFYINAVNSDGTATLQGTYAGIFPGLSTRTRGWTYMPGVVQDAGVALVAGSRYRIEVRDGSYALGSVTFTAQP